MLQVFWGREFCLFKETWDKRTDIYWAIIEVMFLSVANPYKIS